MSHTVNANSVAQDQIRAFIERIERLEEEKKAIADDIKEIYAEAKGNGFDTKVLRKLVAVRKQDTAERLEQEALLELYMAAMGMAVAPRDDDDYEPPGHPLGSTSPPASANLEQRPGATRGMKKAFEKLRDTVDRSGASITIHTAGQEPVTIEPRPNKARPRPPPHDPIGFDLGDDV